MLDGLLNVPRLLWTSNDIQAVRSRQFGGQFCSGDDKRLGTDGREKVIFSRAVRRVSRRKEHRALVIKGGVLAKGSELGTLRGVSRKSEGRSRISDKSSERLVTKGVSGEFLAINSVGATSSDGQLS